MSLTLKPQLLLVAVVAHLAAALSAAPNAMPQGGGVVYPAWKAEFFPNPSLEGLPVWVQSDIRVRHDWETWRPIVGSAGEQVRDFPRDGFSVRWSARLVARFAETYEFLLDADDGARLRLRREGDESWSTLIDAWTGPSGSHRAEVALQPGERYEIVVEYREDTGVARCVLRWRSPSTPEEVVDYVTGSSIRDYRPSMYADINQTGTGNREVPSNAAAAGDFPVDEQGWPAADFSYVLQNGYRSVPGRHLLRFTGLAEIQVQGATFRVGRETFTDRLPKGKGYDAALNRTEAELDLTESATKPRLVGRQTQRTADAPVGSGITGIFFMRPTRHGGDTPHRPGEQTTVDAREAFLPFNLMRVQTTGLNDIVSWSERTGPDYARIHGRIHKNDHAYEKVVAAANELGRDLHLCFGGSIDEDFMRKLAQLIRYGSDGMNPYEGPVENPVWAPLNPNLRLYLEHGNEMGWSAIQPRRWSEDYNEIRRSKSGPVWEAINFDGAIDNDHHTGLMRYHAYRTVRMSEITREVWGDAAMGETVRVFLFGQYERAFQNTMCQYIDDYFNNGTGAHVANPRPVSSILWGAGPAVYYGTTNMWIEGEDIVQGTSFEEYAPGDGVAVMAPEAGPWCFSGNAGVVDVRLPREITPNSVQPEGEHVAGRDEMVGYRFTVGPRDLYVYELGRTVTAGGADRALVTVFTAEGQIVENRLGVTLDLRRKAPGEAVFDAARYSLWASTDSQRVGLYRLQAGKSYVILTNLAKGQVVPGPGSLLGAAEGLTIDGPVTLADGTADGRRPPRQPLVFTPAPGRGFGLPLLRATTTVLEPARGVRLTPPDPSVDPRIAAGTFMKAVIPEPARRGSVMAFLAGRGAIEQDITIPKEGDYAIVVTGAHGHLGDNRIDMFLDDQKVWSGAMLQGSRKHKFGVFQYGSRYTRLSPGVHRLRIETTEGDPGAVVYLDHVHVGSMDIYFGGPEAKSFLGAGAATGQTDGRFLVIARHCTAMSQIWGLVASTYEGGTNAGGDWNGGNVFYTEQAKWEHPYSRVADNNSARVWHAFGGFNNSYYYPAFPDNEIHRPEDFQPWVAARERAGLWELEPSEGLRVPATLTADDPHHAGEPKSTFQGYRFPDHGQGHDRSPALATHAWKSWVVLVPESRSYRLAATIGGEGTARLSVHESQAIAEGSGVLAGEVWLAKGIATIKVRCLSGSVTVDQVVVE